MMLLIVVSYRELEYNREEEINYYDYKRQPRNEITRNNMNFSSLNWSQPVLLNSGGADDEYKFEKIKKPAHNKNSQKQYKRKV